MIVRSEPLVRDLKKEKTSFLWLIEDSGHPQARFLTGMQQTS